MKGLISEKKARELNEQYEQLLKRYTETLGDAGAAHIAAQHFVNIQQNIYLKKMENDARHAIALVNVKSDIKARAERIAAEKSTAFKGSKWLHGDPRVRAVREKLETIYDRQQSLQREMMISIGDIVEQFRSKAGGFKQDVENFGDVVRAAMGETTRNDAANAYGKAVAQMFDKLREMFDDAGGIIGKIDGYFPAFHEPELVGRVSFEEWRDYLMPLLNRDFMTDIDTGLPMDDITLNGIMKQSYESIVTNGLVDLSERAAEGKQTFGTGGDISSRRTSSRFFHFKDADSFLEYNAKFGRGDAGLFDTMLGHIASMTRDIAIMQELGPKSTAVMRNLEMTLQGDGITVNPIKTINGMYDVLSGRNGYGGTLSPMYKFAQGWLNVKRSAYLGSAPVSALSDTFFISLASKMNGIPATKTMVQYLKLLNPLDSTDREVARHLFYSASAASGSSLQGARFSDDVGRGGVTAWLAGVTNRVSGLAAMTDAGRQAPMMSHARMLSLYKAAGTKWDGLEDGIRTAAERFGITEKEWDLVMSAEPMRYADIEEDYILPESVMAIGTPQAEAAARKLGDWQTALGTLAVNEPRLLTRAITTGAVFGDAKQGTLLRLMASNVFFAKSFPITVIINHLLPAMRSASNGRIGHLAAVAVGSTVFGALALQTKQLVTGKETRDMDDANFWMQAFLQGGGAGLFGDFLFSDYNRFGQSIGGTLAGPIAGTAQSLLKAGDLYGLAEGEWDPNAFASDVFKVGSREVPFINLWYSRLLVERGILDQVEKGLDPSYDRRMRRLEQKMQKENGQGWWWRRGELLPEAAQ